MLSKAVCLKNLEESTEQTNREEQSKIRGVWRCTGDKINIFNIYGPHDDSSKRILWESLTRLLDDGDDEAWLLCGDFNEVRDPCKRLNCEFNNARAQMFNDFIHKNRLLEIPLGGRNFTRVSEDGLKFSKLDRFLVCEKFSNIWSNLSAIALERKHSDHCPIMIKDEEKNFGPKPFKVFDAWLDEAEVDQIIKDAWDKIVTNISRKDCMYRNKLKNVKEALRSLSTNKFNNLDGEIELLKTNAINLEIQAESGVLDANGHKLWVDSRKQWLEKEAIKTKMLKQKARVRWILDGDENSNFFTR
ncbi:uncharacterized protein [Rutidosis leptorrhynchoides]|uniref:uncharacterized protein n=1 Tax=Rutidosis leptorrhynchoides TaxID=125765 RepID=UPI003A998DEE